MGKNAELYVRNVVRLASKQIVVVGVPNNNISISVGDVFCMTYKLSDADILNNIAMPQRLQEKPVLLKVEKIEVYRKNVMELTHGMTGGLYLDGSGLELVSPKSFLRTT
jgi:hypothetical protein